MAPGSILTETGLVAGGAWPVTTVDSAAGCKLCSDVAPGSVLATETRLVAGGAWPVTKSLVSR